MSGLLPKRWEMALLLLSGIAIVYTLRVNMSVASVAMKSDLGWSEAVKGYILSAFYWGYMIGQIPSSMLTQKYGGKLIFGLSVAVPSLLTVLVPLACQHSVEMALLIRVLIGFFESATFPCVYHFFPLWVPNAEKTFMIPFILCGIYVGEIVGFSLSGALAGMVLELNGVSYGGWPSIFYVFGFCGLLWFPLWIYAAHESPSVHPTISKDEVFLINLGKDIAADSRRNSIDIAAFTPLLSFTSPLSSYSALDVLDKVNKVDKAEPEINTDTDEEVGDACASGSCTSAGQADTLVLNTAGNFDSSLTHRTAFSLQSSNGKAPTLVDAPEKRYSKRELMARTPWKAMFNHPVAIALMWCNFGYGWIGFTLLSEMPTYLTEVLGFQLGSAGVLCVFPFLALFASTLVFARIFDHLQRNYEWKVSKVRNYSMVIAYMGSATGLLVCCFLSNNYAAYTFMIITQVMHGAAMCGICCVWSDIAPLYSSQLNSIGNTYGALAGIMGPILVSYVIATWPGVTGWRIVFLLTFAMCMSFTAVWFRFIRPGEVVPALNTPNVM